MSYDLRNARKYLAVAQDMTLAEHDKRFHGGRYDPKTMTCEFRERRAKLDPVDADIDENASGIRGIYTGSGASYSMPSLIHVGTGEGSQVYGWGLYGSNQRGVAETYAAGNPSNHTVVMVDGKEWAPPNDATIGEKTAYEQLDDLSNSPEDIAEYCESQTGERYKEAAKFIRSHKIEIRNPHSYIYEQTFFTNRANGDESHLLSWYEPVGAENMNRVIKQGKKEECWFAISAFAPFKNGSQLYDGISKALGSPKAASEFLSRADIDGIKYPVNSYGGKGVKDGDKDGWNYVSFRDDNIRVNKKWVDGVDTDVKDAITTSKA